MINLEQARINSKKWEREQIQGINEEQKSEKGDEREDE